MSDEAASFPRQPRGCKHAPHTRGRSPSHRSTSTGRSPPGWASCSPHPTWRTSKGPPTEAALLRSSQLAGEPTASSLHGVDWPALGLNAVALWTFIGPGFVLRVVGGNSGKHHADAASLAKWTSQ